MTNKKSALRGTMLVDKIIEHIKTDKKSKIKIAQPKPLSPETLKKLRFPKGRELPASLKHFLAFDASWLLKEYGPYEGWFKKMEKPEFMLEPLPDFMNKYFTFGELYEELSKKKIAGDCLEVGIGSDSGRLLFIGKADQHGEYPVVEVDTDDAPILDLYLPGFDVWLGVEAGLFTKEQAVKIYDKDMDDQAKLNLAGQRTWSYFGEWMPVDEHGDPMYGEE